jgi:hypothetical protein
MAREIASAEVVAEGQPLVTSSQQHPQATVAWVRQSFLHPYHSMLACTFSSLFLFFALFHMTYSIIYVYFTYLFHHFVPKMIDMLYK